MPSLHMGSDPVHIPPCRSRGCALAVVPGHTRSENKTKNKKARILAESGPLERVDGSALHVFHSRMRSTTEGCERASAHRGGLHERNPDHELGRAGCCNGPAIHDGSFGLGRWLNTVALYQEFLQKRIAAGEAPKGLDQSFAAGLEISPSMWSQIKSARPIGDKLARQIERHTAKPGGWLDDEHEELQLADAAAERMLKSAGSYWRSANAVEKRALMKLLQRRA